MNIAIKFAEWINFKDIHQVNAGYWQKNNPAFQEKHFAESTIILYRMFIDETCYNNNPVIEFLLRNGFEYIEENSYANAYCNVVLEKDHYAVADNMGGTVYSYNLNIYWLIGTLTYNGFINKNYNDLSKY
jgi:hypothetical protein